MQKYRLYFLYLIYSFIFSLSLFADKIDEAFELLSKSVRLRKGAFLDRNNFQSQIGSLSDFLKKKYKLPKSPSHYDDEQKSIQNQKALDTRGGGGHVFFDGKNIAKMLLGEFRSALINEQIELLKNAKTELEAHQRINGEIGHGIPGLLYMSSFYGSLQVVDACIKRMKNQKTIISQEDFDMFRRQTVEKNNKRGNPLYAAVAGSLECNPIDGTHLEIIKKLISEECPLDEETYLLCSELKKNPRYILTQISQDCFSYIEERYLKSKTK